MVPNVPEEAEPEVSKAPEHKATASVPATGPSLAPIPAPPPSIAAPVVDTVQAAEGTMVAKEEEEEVEVSPLMAKLLQQSAKRKGVWPTRPNGCRPSLMRMR